MTLPAKPTLLCVDDEPLVLEGLTLHLRRAFAVTTATSGAAGLEILREKGPFAVVMSDMRMPGMSGAEFLAKVREMAPDTVRVLLTGHSDLQSAIAAVNEGQIFRFLTKPCPPETLLAALGAAAKQHDLLSSERVLLEQTLHGSIKALTEILSLSNPNAFGRANRAKQFMDALRAEMQLPTDWQCEVAAMLAQIGFIALPADTLERFYEGAALTPEETAMVARAPTVAVQLLSSIPRLEDVRAILSHMDDHFEPTKISHSLRGEAIPWGARALKIILDFLILDMRSNAVEALDVMKGRKGWYDAALFQGFVSVVNSATKDVEARQISARELRQGMVLRENLYTKTGILLVTRGHEVTPGLMERIDNFSRKTGIREPIAVNVLVASPARKAGN